MTPTRDETLAYALAAHGDQVDGAGLPYEGHLLRVEGYGVETAERYGFDDEVVSRVRTVALLHDVVEDTDETPDDLRERGYAERDVAAVLSLSKPKGRKVPYSQAIDAVVASEDPVVILVKIGDNRDNSDEGRLALLPPEKAAKFRAKYGPARERLLAALDRLVAERAPSAAP